jgi:serine/threonine protein kinase
MSKVFTITEGLENMGALRTGGQGSVYKGRRIGPIISAVKLLPTPIYTEDENDKNLRAFQNEVDKLKKVNEVPNPNVVKIMNSGLTESGSFPYIEMEYIEGADLEELLKEPNEPLFTIKETIKLADQLANALAHCHQVGVKHGDIKSNNIKYNIHSGNYVLLDFGLAIMSDEQRRTSIRHAGAIEFMAPEQNTGVMLFQTDIYSYGIILYELLAGQVPFPLGDNGETSRNTVMVAHMETPVPDLMELRKKNLPKSWTKEKRAQEMRVPQWLLNIITKCLAKDPESRYANGMVLQEAIIEGSVGADPSPDINTGLSILQDENDQLKAQLSKYQQDETKSKAFIKITKPVLAGIVVLMIAALAFGFIGMLSKKPEPIVTAQNSNFISPLVAFPTNNFTKKSNGQYRSRSSAVDTADDKSLSSSDSVKIVHYKAKLIHAHKAAKSKVVKKRKKFLGIF